MDEDTLSIDEDMDFEPSESSEDASDYDEAFKLLTLWKTVTVDGQRKTLRMFEDVDLDGDEYSGDPVGGSYATDAGDRLEFSSENDAPVPGGVVDTALGANLLNIRYEEKESGVLVFLPGDLDRYVAAVKGKRKYAPVAGKPLGTVLYAAQHVRMIGDLEESLGSARGAVRLPLSRDARHNVLNFLYTLENKPSDIIVFKDNATAYHIHGVVSSLTPTATVDTILMTADAGPPPTEEWLKRNRKDVDEVVAKLRKARVVDVASGSYTGKMHRMTRHDDDKVNYKLVVSATARAILNKAMWHKIMSIRTDPPPPSAPGGDAPSGGGDEEEDEDEDEDGGPIYDPAVQDYFMPMSVEDAKAILDNSMQSHLDRAAESLSPTSTSA